MNVLLSIRPEHAENILSGRKRYEFRRKIFKRSDVRSVVIYATAPIQMLVGEFQIGQIIEASPKELWRQTRDWAGISGEYFDDYFEGRSVGFAIEVKNVVRYEDSLNPRSLFDDFTPPQSYMYINRSAKVTQPSLGGAQLELCW